MAVTLEWIRDHYDVDKSRRISTYETQNASRDHADGKITDEEKDAVIAAWTDSTLLPVYTTGSGGTPLLWIRDNYDVDKSRYIELPEANTAWDDYKAGKITRTQYIDIAEAHDYVLILPEYGTTPPPETETRTMSLEEGEHTIEVQLSGYDQFKARINVGSARVTCASRTGFAPCGGSGTPRVEVDGWSVRTYLKTSSGGGGSGRCDWIASQDITRVAFISQMVLAYAGLTSIGFTPTASEIGQGVLMYASMGTPSSLWGC